MWIIGLLYDGQNYQRLGVVPDAHLVNLALPLWLSRPVVALLHPDIMPKTLGSINIKLAECPSCGPQLLPGGRQPSSLEEGVSEVGHSATWQVGSTSHDYGDPFAEQIHIEAFSLMITQCSE